MKMKILKIYINGYLYFYDKQTLSLKKLFELFIFELTVLQKRKLRFIEKYPFFAINKYIIEAIRSIS